MVEAFKRIKPNIIHDIQLVAWKERIMFLSNKEVSLGVFLLPIIYGILFPFSFSTLKNLIPTLAPSVLILSISFVAAIISGIDTAYAFAWERETLTIQTLLTTRLSDAALVLGKALFGLTSSIIAYLTMLVLYLSTDYFLVSGDPILTIVLKPEMLYGLLIVPLMFTLFSVSTGMVISTKIKSTRTGAGLAALPALPIVALMGWFIFGNPLGLSFFLNLIVISLILFGISLMCLLLSIGLFKREAMALRQ